MAGKLWENSNRKFRRNKHISMGRFHWNHSKVKFPQQGEFQKEDFKGTLPIAEFLWNPSERHGTISKEAFQSEISKANFQWAKGTFNGNMFPGSVFVRNVILLMLVMLGKLAMLGWAAEDG